MPGEDWVVGGDRRAAAAERIYDAAICLMRHDGMNGLDIDKLAARVHCSRATIYRYVGGKAKIRDGVVARVAARITNSVRSAVEPLSGPERVTTAILSTLHEIRSEPLCRLMMSSVRGGTREVAWLAEMPQLAEFASELMGIAGGHPQAAKWGVRVVLTLMYWPGEDDDAERELVENFVTPAFVQSR
ncbi:putative HTH-type transcriptional regulator [Mycobacterium simulans]|uniref:TetR/AcrR family transcriptional regulator n=1 Tax=Mycobacterium simulans TaxID=627089 RepID=UPI00174A032A|nr:TetR/AcrR family transcriptional regulator [Mycobacterium simulans]SON61434.1 putative HTH-type transcriptional regulator [Mycobacterium simulans]